MLCFQSPRIPDRALMYMYVSFLKLIPCQDAILLAITKSMYNQVIYEPLHKKTNKILRQKQWRRSAVQLLCSCAFVFATRIVPLLLKSEISSFNPAVVTVQAGLCQSWSETQIVVFLMHRLIWTITCEFTKEKSIYKINHQMRIESLSIPYVDIDIPVPLCVR